ncbi:MAG: flippase-like domain-containing protein [Candidatus Aenigmarchaeota archaeon]|nr:flippase-like domain-containing protein [Candidatus Aenigmarchaeota archaeon]
MKKLAVFIISIIVMLLTISFFGIGEVAAVLIASNIRLVLIAIICQLAIIFLYGMRFKIITSKYKKLSIKESINVATIGNFVSQITPVAKIGGQPLMIYMIKGKIGSEKSSAVVIMDTVVDFIVSVLLVALIIAFFYSLIPIVLLVPLVIFALITLGLIFGFLKMFLSKDALSRVIDWLLEKAKRFKKIDKIFHTNIFQYSFSKTLHDKKIMSLGMTVSAAIKGFEMLRIWIVFAAIGIVLPTSLLLIIWAVMLLVLSIPWLPGHLGLFEFGVSSAFVILGLVPSQAAGGILLDRFISFWFVLAFSAILIWISRNKISHIINMSEEKELE